ncbi:MAG TPA: FAD:protein FMN transferase [Hellea balneolensis]|uniref:FAD:protein FMN transferase n=1 Tax=Hellea balneolensis TaxID=287478 RepID=A0A7C5QXP5_9PROT|nr:FAD:protein FMN transferase [Hellea balneolensis]
MTELPIQIYSFCAMASPCELRIETQDLELAHTIGTIVEQEAKRIEQKFSRYRDDSIISRINAANGQAVELDEETAGLIDYAANCFELSEGQFDITSGILRRAWRFDGSSNVPKPENVTKLLPMIGWDKVEWKKPFLRLGAGMEIDFGGLGKEYAVDRALLVVQAQTDLPALVNFGGDLRVTGPLGGRTPWQITLQSVDRDLSREGILALSTGALATSGDAQRFLLKNGIRYSHILDPRTGWPVEDPPRSVTVSAPTCMEAGILSTLAMLRGRGAEKFLKQEGIKAWCIR